MAMHELGLRLERHTTLPPLEAWERSRALLSGYEGLGFDVRFSREEPPRGVSAALSDRNGTQLVADVDVTATGALTIDLRGRVHVGGFAGALASRQQVERVARERLVTLLDREFAAPTATRTAPAPAARITVEELDAKLRALRGLVERGVIDEADLQAKKAELLGRL
jgi:hypothetical protein